jgi:hypothetical protein
MSSESNQNPNSHRRYSRAYEEDFPPLPSAPRLPPLRSLSLRRGSVPSVPNPPLSRYYRQHINAAASPGRRHERQRNPLFDSRSTIQDLEDLNHSLDEANSHLRALLDLTTHNTFTTPLMPPNMSPPLRPQDYPEESRRVKRRKLDSDRLVSSFKGFRYGKYGQVVPGQLTMEIVSCDGGSFSTEAKYAAENILKSDNSVYCTKGNTCNIVLCHQGATVFSLSELIIKAPGSNYTAP